MNRSDSQSPLSDNLLALPRWATVFAVGLLSVAVTLGFLLLLIPGLDNSLRGDGAQLLVVSLPALALTIGFLGATWASTARIDNMVAWYLRHTIGDKLEAYLVGSKDLEVGPSLYPPLFKRMERQFRKGMNSYCIFQLFDDHDRRFDLLVKSNVFNFEICFWLHVKALPGAAAPILTKESHVILSLDEWTTFSSEPIIDFVGDTLYGSVSEGYSVFAEANPESDGLCMTYILRQKIESNFLVSPYLRRYFAEDAAIASYFLYAEAFAKAAGSITGGEM
jgi:hypothetical protein